MSDDSTNASNSSVPVTELTLRQIFFLLKAGELAKAIAWVGTILAAVASFMFATGRWWAIHYDELAMNHIDAVKSGNVHQIAIRRRPAVKAFEAFLAATQDRRWSDAAGLVGPQWIAKGGAVSDLERQYRMTYKQEPLYYIPVSITDNEEVYDVDFRFSDFVPPLSQRDALRRSKVETAFAAAVRAPVVDEVTRLLPASFVVPPTDSATLRERVSAGINGLEVQDLVRDDCLVDTVGDRLAYAPIPTTADVTGNHLAPTEKRRMIKLTLSHIGDAWKVNEYTSFMREVPTE